MRSGNRINSKALTTVSFRLSDDCENAPEKKKEIPRRDKSETFGADFYVSFKRINW